MAFEQIYNHELVLSACQKSVDMIEGAIIHRNSTLKRTAIDVQLSKITITLQSVLLGLEREKITSDTAKKIKAASLSQLAEMWSNTSTVLDHEEKKIATVHGLNRTEANPCSWVIPTHMWSVKLFQADLIHRSTQKELMRRFSKACESEDSIDLEIAKDGMGCELEVGNTMQYTIYFRLSSLHWMRRNRSAHTCLECTDIPQSKLKYVNRMIKESIYPDEMKSFICSRVK